MPKLSEFEAFVIDLFAPLGEASVRRMFGGAGVYMDGMMMALLADEQIYLKVDDQTRAEFEAAGLGPFLYEHKEKGPLPMAYHAMPDAAFDDPDVLAHWGGLAMAAARRGQAKKDAAAAKKKKG